MPKETAIRVLDRFSAIGFGDVYVKGTELSYVVGIEPLERASLFKRFLDAHEVIEYKLLSAEQILGDTPITDNPATDRIILQLVRSLRC